MTDLFYGSVNQQVVGHVGQTCFYEALKICYSQLLTYKNTLTVTNFILFNYHRRDRNGLLGANGAAVLIHFGSFDELVLFIFLMKVIPTN